MPDQISPHQILSLRPGETISGYVIEREIGQGGFGIVYKGYNHGLKRHAAIKEFFPKSLAYRQGSTVILKDGADSEVFGKILRKFTDTTAMLSHLDHPHIVKVRNYEEKNGTAYMIMDYVDGETALAWAQRLARPPSQDELRAVFAPAFEAVAYLHAQGLIHRDISPMNVMLRRDGSGPVLIDFGTMKQQFQDEIDRHTRAQSSIAICNRSYAAPEQLASDSSKHKAATDIYAAAASLYHMVSGAPPVSASDRKDAVSLYGAPDPYQPAAAVAKGPYPAYLLAAIDRAITLQPDRRTQSMAAFLAELGWSAPAAPASGWGASQQPTVALGWGPGPTNAAHGAAPAPPPLYVQPPPAAGSGKTVAPAMDKWERTRMIAMILGIPLLFYIVVTGLFSTRKYSEAPSGAVSPPPGPAARKDPPPSASPQRISYENESLRLVRTLTGHTDIVSSVSFSGSGDRLASSSEDGSVIVWDFGSGRRLHVFQGNGGLVMAAAFSRDGSRILSGVWDGSMKMTDARGAELWSFNGRMSRIYAIAFSPDGRTVFTAGCARRKADQQALCATGSIKAWNIATGSELLSFGAHGDDVRAIAVSPDGRLILSGGDDFEVKLWDAASGREIPRLRNVPRDLFHAVAFSPDGRLAVAGGSGRQMTMWNVATGEVVRAFTQPRSSFKSAQFSPDGRFIVTANDSVVTLWDAASGRILHEFTGHGGVVTAAAFSPDGRFIASSSNDKTLKIWDAAEWTRR